MNKNEYVLYIREFGRHYEDFIKSLVLIGFEYINPKFCQRVYYFCCRRNILHTKYFQHIQYNLTGVFIKFPKRMHLKIKSSSFDDQEKTK